MKVADGTFENEVTFVPSIGPKDTVCALAAFSPTNAINAIDKCLVISFIFVLVCVLISL